MGDLFLTGSDADSDRLLRLDVVGDGKRKCLLLAPQSQECHHGVVAGTAKYAEDGDGHPSRDDQDKG